MLHMLLLAAPVLGFGPAPAKPACPTQFQAKVTIRTIGEASLTGAKGANQTGTMWYDEQRQVVAWQTLEDASFAPGHVLNTTYWSNATSAQYVANGRCNPLTGKFGPFFSWLPVAQYGGNTTINGQQCTLWQLVSAATNLTLCTVGNTPVLFRTAVSSSHTPIPGLKSGRTVTSFYWDYDSFTTPNPNAFTEPVGTRPNPLHGGHLACAGGTSVVHSQRPHTAIYLYEFVHAHYTQRACRAHVHVRERPGAA